MRERTCCFTGHRNLPQADIESIYEKTVYAIKTLISQGMNTFVCGGAIGFDMMCAKIIAKMKNEGERINLVMALPCKNQDKYYSASDKKEYERLVSFADKVIYVCEKYNSRCMNMRNRFMVDNSACIISYCTKLYGGSAATRAYAAEKGIRIIDVN